MSRTKVLGEEDLLSQAVGATAACATIRLSSAIAISQSRRQKRRLIASQLAKKRGLTGDLVLSWLVRRKSSLLNRRPWRSTPSNHNRATISCSDKYNRTDGRMAAMARCERAWR